MLEMIEVAGQPGVYETTYDAAAPGIYRFEASAVLEEETLGSARVAVRRQDGIAEHFRIEQNRPLLERLAAATGGRYFARQVNASASSTSGHCSALKRDVT